VRRIFPGAVADRQSHRQPPAGEGVEHRAVFGKAQRLVERAECDAAADPHPPGARRYGAEHDERRGHVTVFGKVMLRHPGAIETECFGLGNDVQRIGVKRLGRAAPGRRIAEVV